MSIISVVRDPTARARLEIDHVIGRGALLVDDGVCSVHPARSSATTDERALAIVRSLRHSLTREALDGRGADVLFAALSRAEAESDRDVTARAARHLGAPALAQLFADGTEATTQARASVLTHLLGAPSPTGRPCPTAAPKAILGHLASWDAGTRRLHWDALLAEERDVIIVSADRVRLDLNLYGLLEHPTGRFRLEIENRVPTTVADRHLAGRVRRRQPERIGT